MALACLVESRDVCGDARRIALHPRLYGLGDASRRLAVHFKKPCVECHGAAYPPPGESESTLISKRAFVVRSSSL